MAIHHPGSRAGTGVALKAIREAVMHGSGKGIFATLNVVPMIDLFTMLVIFLIQQYSASGELTLVNPNVALPKAGASAELARAPMIGLTRADSEGALELFGGRTQQMIMTSLLLEEVRLEFLVRFARPKRARRYSLSRSRIRSAGRCGSPAVRWRQLERVCKLPKA